MFLIVKIYKKLLEKQKTRTHRCTGELVKTYTRILHQPNSVLVVCRIGIVLQILHPGGKTYLLDLLKPRLLQFQHQGKVGTFWWF